MEKSSPAPGTASNTTCLLQCLALPEIKLRTYEVEARDGKVIVKV